MKKKWKGKEYNIVTEILKFEGEFVNGVKIGIGKEYDEYWGYLKFEGEFKDGDRNGKGKEIRMGI